ncbi:MAG: tail fiber domain-containing protein [Acidobacteriota bacterium]
MVQLPRTLGIALALLLALSLAPAQAQPAVEATVDGDVLVLRPQVEHQGLSVSLHASDGSIQQLSFEAAAEVVIPLRDESGAPLPDGLVSWEVVVEPKLSADAKGLLAQARAEGEALNREQLVKQGLLPAGELRASGAVRLFDGRAPAPQVEEAEAASAAAAAFLVDTSHQEEGFLAEEQIIIGDLIVYNSMCVGSDCEDPESYGFDTIRLKENNLRIHFEDTSQNAFPSNDWRLEANSSANGGANYFGIVDANTSRTVVRVNAAAPSSSMVVDFDGDVGFGTLNAAVDLHVVDGDSPTLRLEQDGSSGFGAQTWDVAGNETNFFVRNVTNGSNLVLRIRPQAPDDALYIENDGFIGFGTASPDASLHVETTQANNFGGLRVENKGAGNIQTQFANTSGNGWEWRQTFRSGDLIFDSQEDGANELELDINGELTVVSLVETSDRAMKENFQPVDRGDVLSKIVELPITRWNYIDQGAEIEHLGPMAQDFYGAFGVGPDEKHIATRDAASVALVGVQALYELLEQKQSEIELLRERLERLEAAQGTAP